MRPKRALTTSCGEAVYLEITECICVRIITKTLQSQQVAEIYFYHSLLCISIFILHPHTSFVILYYKVQVLVYFSSIEYQTKAQ